MRRGGVATLEIHRAIAMVGVAGIMACGSGARTEPTAETSGAAASAAHAQRGGSSVVVQTSPGTFVGLDPAFAHEFPPAEGAAYIDQQGQMFTPDTLLVRTGQPVHFRSGEDVLQNAGHPQRQDAHLQRRYTAMGQLHAHLRRARVLQRDACDIHIAMRATMYVAATPYVGMSDEHGRFTFEHVVPGT